MEDCQSKVKGNFGRKLNMIYQLMNFDLGSNPNIREFSLGSYKIKLLPNYDEVQTKLSSSRKIVETTKVIEGRVEFEREIIEAKAGINVVTATVECENEDESFLTNETSKGIWDVFLILSYLSGRYVFLPEEERRYSSIGHGFSVVPKWQIPKAAKIAWQYRDSFINDSEKRPLWYLLHSNSTSEVEIKLLCGFVSIEIIQNIEKEDVSVKSIEQESLENVLTQLKDVINKSSIDKELKNRLKGTIGSWGNRSSMQSFKDLLLKYDLVKSDVEGLPLKRVEGINRMRNGIVHRGIIRLPDWISDEAAKQKASRFIGARFVPALIMEYLNRKFNLKEFDWVKRNKDILTEYIYYGSHEGDFKESIDS